MSVQSICCISARRSYKETSVGVVVAAGVICGGGGAGVALKLPKCAFNNLHFLDVYAKQLEFSVYVSKVATPSSFAYGTTISLQWCSSTAAWVEGCFVQQRKVECSKHASSETS